MSPYYQDASVTMSAAERQRRYRARARGEDVPKVKAGSKAGVKKSPSHAAKIARFGPDHHAWKGDAVSKKVGRARCARRFAVGVCMRCVNPGKDRHHVDGNPLNNIDSNIEILCRACHVHEHILRRAENEAVLLR